MKLSCMKISLLAKHTLFGNSCVYLLAEPDQLGHRSVPKAYTISREAVLVGRS